MALWRRSDRLFALGAALACLLTSGYFAVRARDESRVRNASELALQGRYTKALATAGAVSRRPAVTRALSIRAYAAFILRREREASRFFRRAIARDPNRWTLRRDWARVLRRLGEIGAARREMSRALALNPRMTLPPGFERRTR